MKTIDEVIKAMEYCQTPDQMGNCNVNCPYIHCCDPESVAIKTDALQYLKEYRDLQKMTRTERLIDVLREVRGEK